MDTKQQHYIENLKAELKQWNAELDRFQKKGEQASQEARKQYHRTMIQLKERRDELEKRLSELSESSEASWEKLKDGVDNAWHSFKKGLQQAQAEFRD